MVLYNVTVNIDSNVEEEWLHWMRTFHIPKVMATGKFVENKIFRLLHDEGDGSTTYSVQFFASDVKDVNEYLEHYAPPLVQAHMEKYKDKHVAFRTLMEQIP